MTVWLKPKIHNLFLEFLLFDWLFGCSLSRQPLDIYCLIWWNGTNRLATSTSDAEVGCNLGYRQSILKRNHVYSLSGTMFGAGSAIFIFGKDHTHLFPELRHTNLRHLFLFHSQSPQRVCWANIGANSTFIIAIDMSAKRQMRLHNAR